MSFKGLTWVTLDTKSWPVPVESIALNSNQAFSTSIERLPPELTRIISCQPSKYSSKFFPVKDVFPLILANNELYPLSPSLWTILKAEFSKSKDNSPDLLSMT